MSPRFENARISAVSKVPPDQDGMTLLRVMTRENVVRLMNFRFVLNPWDSVLLLMPDSM